MRQRMRGRVDEIVFRRTAANSKSINLGSRIMRGGTRF